MSYKGRMAEGFDKAEVVVGEVEVRPARSDERRRWDALMAAHHYLGFRQFRGPRAAPRRGVARALAGAGRVAVGGVQVRAARPLAALAPIGAVPSSAPDRQQHAVPGPAGGGGRAEPGVADAGPQPAPAERGLGGAARPSAGARGDVRGPVAVPGACYDASNWVRVGRTKGFARHNGGYTDSHACPKEMFVRALRADARTRLADPADRPQWACRATPVRYTHEELRSLRGLFAEVPDSRRGQGRKHRLATVLSVCALARLAGQYGPAATERFARNLDQEELRALGAWRSAEGRWVAPSDSTVCRVLADTDPDALQDMPRRWAAPRLAEDADMPALAADGARP